jgi:hypothetical protein
MPPSDINWWSCDVVRALDRYFRGSTRVGAPQVNHRQPVAPPPRVKHAFDFILFFLTGTPTPRHQRGSAG